MMTLHTITIGTTSHVGTLIRRVANDQAVIRLASGEVVTGKLVEKGEQTNG